MFHIFDLDISEIYNPGFLYLFTQSISKVDHYKMLKVPPKYSTFWSSEQTREHDDFLLLSVLVIYQVFGAFQSPIRKLCKLDDLFKMKVERKEEIS